MNLLEQFSLLKVEERERIGEISKKIRSVIEGAVIAKEMQEEITHLLPGLVKKMPMLYVPVLRRRICQRHPLQASRIRI